MVWVARMAGAKLSKRPRNGRCHRDPLAAPRAPQEPAAAAPPNPPSRCSCPGTGAWVRMASTLTLMLASLAVGAAAYVQPASPHLRSTLPSVVLAAASDDSNFASDGQLPIVSNADETLLPQFSWRKVGFFCLNPALLAPVPLVAVCCSRFLGSDLQILGSAFSTSMAAARLAVLYAIPMILVSLLPLERIKMFESFAEVTAASSCICLYALGAKFKPVKALIASMLISMSAGVFEELAFRGVVQSLLELGCLVIFPSRLALALAMTMQAAVFGVLHSYTPSPAYFISASLAGLVLGVVFAQTRNLFVCMVMHFILDIVSFCVCHFQVSRSGIEAQNQLINSPSPIARALAGSSIKPK